MALGTENPSLLDQIVPIMTQNIMHGEDDSKTRTQLSEVIGRAVSEASPEEKERLMQLRDRLDNEEGDPFPIIQEYLTEETGFQF